MSTANLGGSWPRRGLLRDEHGGDLDECFALQAVDEKVPGLGHHANACGLVLAQLSSRRCLGELLDQRQRLRELFVERAHVLRVMRDPPERAIDDVAERARRIPNSIIDGVL